METCDRFYFSYTKRRSDGLSFLTNGFRVISEEGNETLLFRKYDERFDYTKKPIYVKEDDLNDN